jgi:hypothetical protein
MPILEDAVDADEHLDNAGRTTSLQAPHGKGRRSRRDRRPRRPATVSRDRRLVAGRPSVVPSARASLGALLCLLAGLLTYVAIDRAHQPPTTRFAVAARDLAPGDILGPADVALVTMDLPSAVRSRAVEGSLDTLDGVTILGPLARGELLQRGALVRRATPLPTFSFPVQAEYANAGRVRPGSRVSIYATDGNDTRLVARDVLVIRTDGAEAVRGPIVLTIALDPGVDEVALVGAASRDKLAVVEGVSTGTGSATADVPLDAAADASQATVPAAAAAPEPKP